MISQLRGQIDGETPILLAGPTASGKSALALKIAEQFGGTIINADALQVFADWRILTARPDESDLRRAPHVLYGHVDGSTDYSVGAWMRDVKNVLGRERPIFVGGTGLYFAALTEGLADIPDTPDALRSSANERRASHGIAALIAELDDETAAKIDLNNPMRVQRAWEVLKSTGLGLAAWQRDTGPALLPLDGCQAFVLNAGKDWLENRIRRRIDRMLDEGVLDEARTNVRGWSPDRPSAKAIGARELIAHAEGRLAIDDVRETMAVQTRRYAKRQRSWFRNRMKGWHWIDVNA